MSLIYRGGRGEGRAAGGEEGWGRATCLLDEHAAENVPAPAPAAGDELRAAGLRRLYPQDVGLWKRHCARREDGIGRNAWRKGEL